MLVHSPPLVMCTVWGIALVWEGLGCTLQYQEGSVRHLEQLQGGKMVDMQSNLSSIQVVLVHNKRKGQNTMTFHDIPVKEPCRCNQGGFLGCLMGRGRKTSDDVHHRAFLT